MHLNSISVYEILYAIYTINEIKIICDKHVIGRIKKTLCTINKSKRA